MSQHVADVNLVSIIVHRSDQSNFVAADIKDSEFSGLVGVRKDLAQLHEVQKSAFPHNPVPMRERCFGVRMLFSKLIQALPRNDVHCPARGYRTFFSEGSTAVPRAFETVFRQ